MIEFLIAMGIIACIVIIWVLVAYVVVKVRTKIQQRRYWNSWDAKEIRRMLDHIARQAALRNLVHRSHVERAEGINKAVKPEGKPDEN